MDEAPAPLLQLTVAIHNGETRTIVLLLEPWAEMYDLEPGAELEIRMEGPPGHHLPIRWQATGPTVYGWPGSIATVHRDGVEVEPHF